MWIAAAALMIGVAVGALTLGDDDSTSNAQTDSEGTIQAVSFEAPGQADRRVVLDVGGLTLTAACNRVPPGGDIYLLSLTAKSQRDGASAVSGYMQREPSGQTYSYLFRVRDFDPAYGAYDLLGSPYTVSGDLNYMRDDGGQVSVSYVADQDRSKRGCQFGGTAVYAPA